MTKLSITEKIGVTLHACAKPIEAFVHGCVVFKNEHKTLVTLTFSLMVALAGGYMAECHQETLPHFVWDTASYGIHGLGLAPIAKFIFNLIKIEI